MGRSAVMRDGLRNQRAKPKQLMNLYVGETGSVMVDGGDGGRSRVMDGGRNSVL